MPEMKVPLLKGDAITADVQYRANLPENMYAVINPLFGVPGFMTAHPGVRKYGDVPGADRGGNWNERFSEHLRVSGQKFIEVQDDGTIIEIGDIDGTAQASLPYSFNTQAIIADEKMWLYDPTNGLVPVTDIDLGFPIDGCWVDGYYFLTDGEFLYHTELNDESAIEPEKFATAEFSPDPTLGVAKTQDNQVIVFNRYTTEFFRDVGVQVEGGGTTGFVFARVAGKATKVGIIGTHLKIEMDGNFFCLGSAKDEAPTMLIIGAGKSQNFSTREIDSILNEYTELELSTGVMTTKTRDRERLIYVHLANDTLLYNDTVAQAQGVDFAWSVLKNGSQVVTPWHYYNGIYDPRVNLWIGGDRYESILNYLDIEYGGQENEETEYVLYTPFVTLETASVDRLEIETIPGQQVGPVTAFLSITYDGVTFGKEWTLDYSKERGDYGTRFIFRRLGYCRDWMGFRLRLVTESKVAFADMVLTYG